MIKAKKVYLPDVVGSGYGTFWNSKQRYRVIKGSRRSKKSKTEALDVIYKMMKYPLSNTLVVRKTLASLKDSCYAELKWAANRLNVSHLWEFKLSPLEAVYKPTGQKIFFRGLDDPLKITSITVEVGALTFMWIEEAFEIDNEADFDTLMESMLGYCPEGHYKQVTLTFNPWSANHWIKRRFFDVQDPDILAITTNYLCNEWLSDEDRKVFDKMRDENPDRYKVAGLGEWGMDGMTAFPEFREELHVCDDFTIPPHWTRYRAFDYGLDKFALLWFAFDEKGDMYVFDEFHESDLIISSAAEKALKHSNETVLCTYAPPDMWNRNQDSGKTKADIFAEHGMPIIKSVNDRVTGWANVREWLTLKADGTARLHIMRRCRTLISYLPQLLTDPKNINDVAKEPHELTHIADAFRYMCVMRPIPAELPIEDNDEYVSYDDGLDNFFAYGG